MPEEKTLKKAKRDLAQGKRPSTAAGEFVREEIEHVRHGQHGARSPQQAIAIGLSKARRAGVPLPPPAPGRTSNRTRRAAKKDLAKGAGGGGTRAKSPRRSRAALAALKREGHHAASPKALAQHAERAAKRRSPRQRSRAAKTAAATKGPAVPSANRPGHDERS
jgi:hypothetical protein